VTTWVLVAYACKPTSQEAEFRKIKIKVSQSTKERPYLKNTKTKKGWQSGLSSRTPAEQA
jgi:hypothetical protein